jgi:subfamily B ATP-binding cassette protein MsbA
MAYYLRVLSYFKPYFWHFFWSLLLVLLFTAANIYFLPLTRDIITELNGKDLGHINNQILNAIGLFAIRLAAQNGQLYLMTSLSNLIIIDIRLDIYKKLQNLSQSFYSEWKIGDILTRLFSDGERVREMVMQSFGEVLPQVFTFIGILIYLFFMNWKLTVFTIISLPVFIGIIGFAADRLKRNAMQLQRKTADITHVAQETLSNVKAVQASTMEAYEVQKFLEENRSSYKTTMAGVAVKSRIEPLISFLQFCVIGVVVWYGGYEMSKGNMSGANLAAFFTGILLLIDPVLALSKVYNNIQQGLASAQRVFEILDMPMDIKSSDNPQTLTSIEGRISFENVGFRYMEDGPFAVHNFSLDVNPGQTIALVGLSGAGKSTLINLIPRFYDPTEGRILLDGVDMRELDLHQLRSHIGVVPQEDVLFRGSVLDNVRYGTPNASEDEVKEALHLANAWDFVEQLPGKMMAKIGDRGRKLSGGQKQRLSIARAILRNPKILILDEATSALDSKSEKLVQDALLRLMSNRTTFVIAHRLSTIVHAHQIIVMEGGKIAEVGKHDDLLQQNGIYAKLYHLQFQKQATTPSRLR